MFGIDDMILFPMLGAAAGGLLNKKDPLKGALLGGALGAGGGLLSTPAAAGLEGASALAANPLANAQAAAAYGTNLGSQQTAMLAAQDAAFAEPSLLGSSLKPFGQAAQAASAVKNLTQSPAPQPIQASPVMTGQGGAQGLSQLVANNATKVAQLEAQAAQRKQRKYGQIGLLGGNYGLA